MRDSIKRWLSRDQFLPVFIFALAFILRLAVWFQARGCPWFDRPVMDSEEYDLWAKEIAGGALFWGTIRIHGPLYPYFLALIYALGGGFKYFLLRLVQFAIGSFNAVLVYLIAKKALSRAGAVIAGLAAAVYWIFVYFDYHVFPTTLEILLSLLLIRQLFANRERPGWRGWLAAGLLLGLSGISRPNALLLVPVIMIWMIALARGKIRAAGRIAAFLAGVIVVVAPVTWRNYRIGGDFVLVQANTGLNLYLGNNPRADGTPYARPGSGWEELQRLPFQEGETGIPAEADRFFFSAIRRFIREHPVQFLRLQFKKLVLFWNHYEIKASMDAYFFTRFSPLLAFLSRTLNFRVVGPLALLGLFLRAKRSREAAPLYVFTLGYLGTIVVTVVSERYRAPLVPGLLIFAAGAVIREGEWLQKGDYRRFALSLPALLFFAALVNCDLYRPPPRLEAEEFYNLGSVHLYKRNYREAEKSFLAALRDDPAYVKVHYNLGMLYKDTNRLEEAIKEFKKTVELDPGYAAAYNNLAAACYARGEYVRAVEYCDLAIRRGYQVNPGFIEALRQYRD